MPLSDKQIDALEKVYQREGTLKLIDAMLVLEQAREANALRAKLAAAESLLKACRSAMIIQMERSGFITDWRYMIAEIDAARGEK